MGIVMLDRRVDPRRSGWTMSVPGATFEGEFSNVTPICAAKVDVRHV
jgi:hypothetical protein